MRAPLLTQPACQLLHSHHHTDLLLQVREYLEKHYEEKSGMEAVKLAIKALTETVEAGSKNIEVGSPPTPHRICN